MDYEDFGYNSRLQKIGGFADRMGTISGIEYDPVYGLQTHKISASRVANQKLVEISEVAETSGTDTVANGTHVVFTATISPSTLYLDKRNLATPFVSIYAAGTSTGSLQIFPAPGAGIVADSWRCSAGYDERAYTGTNSVYRITAYNNSGGLGTVYGRIQWKYIQNNSGLSS